MQAFLNGDLPVPTDNMHATISAILNNGLTFQAEHQHFYDFSPIVWFVARRNPIYTDGIRVNPATNIATNVAFEPLNSNGSEAAAAPDFGMVTSEVNRVIGTMRAQGWDIGCLYNQETGETPQLFFSHNFKMGDPYVLAQEIRNGLNQTNSQ